MGVGAFVLFQLLLLIPGVTDAVFGRLNPPFVWTLSRVSGLFPFSIMELLIAAYVIAVGVRVVRGVCDVFCGYV